MHRTATVFATALALAISLPACGGDSKGEHWSKRPTETITGETEGIKFSIDVPKGMRKQDDMGGTKFDFLIDDRVYTPDISVRAGGTYRDMAKHLETESVKEFLRKEESDSGFVLAYENPYYKGKEDYIVYLKRKAGEKSLTCQARIRPWKRGGKAKGDVPALENLPVAQAAVDRQRNTPTPCGF